MQLPQQDVLAKQRVQILLPPPGWDKDNTQPEVPSSSSPRAAEHGASSSPGRGPCSGRDELFSSGHSSRLPRSARAALLSRRQGCDQGKWEKHLDGWREAVRIAPVRTEQRMLPVQACSQPRVTVEGVCARSWAAWDVTSATREPSCSGCPCLDFAFSPSVLPCWGSISSGPVSAPCLLTPGPSLLPPLP